MVHGEGGEEGGWDIPIATEATLLRQQSDALLQLPALSLGSTRKSLLHSNHTSAAAAHHKESRPGSSGSSASFSLIHTLRRSGTGNASTDSSATGASGWSFLSSIWSNPRSSASEASTYPDEPVDCTAPPRSLHSSVCAEKYDDEVVVQEHDLYPGYDEQIQSPPRFDSVQFSQQLQQDAPLNVSIAEDGVVDVEIPLFPSILSLPIFGHSTANSSSPIGSPASTGYNSLDRSSFSFNSFLNHCEDTTDTTLNVAGWMEDERFHPDFCLQAVKPYTELEADIRRAMRAEPTPALLPGTPTDKWVDVCSVLLADTRTYTIKRLKLKRRMRASNLMTGTAITPTTFIPTATLHQRTPSFSSNEEEYEEEEYEEEWVMDMDDTLATAVERTIGVDSETCSSRTSTTNKQQTKPRSALGKDPTIPPPTPDNTTINSKSLGSDCKGLILGALEEVVKRCATARTTGGAGFVENVLTEGVVRWLHDIEGFSAVSVL